ncbi:nucleoside-diphosphate-sugar epimerase [Diplodia corticola]|uniref:Nucleoside-diphosphate-sugar epimerase n=1 Tax=Diplodia corticola TaxID=236234 RepID=A0A1J9R1C5_9PEZI|nr:nucleoside-diphosphate-sugar epimerase [Diplodia corticola]OJD34424.1 nucleoside-diphosphate-sugar epimerase [Diplodia corticola]
MAKHILITGASGFVGQELAAALLDSSPDVHLTLTDVAAPKTPAGATDPSRITSTQTDLTDPAAARSLLDTQKWTAIYTLHGIMSSGAEADFALGYRVNLDAHRHLYDHLIATQPGATVVFTSSTAVYGPPSTAGGPDHVFSERTLPQPQSSYGTQKFVVECLLNDYARRGLLDARVVRLPTVMVRPGAPTAAASSFASGIVREPLNGARAVLPVDRRLRMWVCSPRTVVRNLVAVKDVAAARFGPLSRTVNLPGVTVRIADVLDALEQVGGRDARALVEEKVDPVIEKIVLSWPERFDIERALGLGLEEDGTLIETVKAYADSLKK